MRKIGAWTAVLLTSLASATPMRDGARDFDWEIGDWHTALKRRLHPLTGSEEWVEYSGTTRVRPVWGGAANLVELDVRGAPGRLEGLSLRLYDPKASAWSLNFANRAGAEMTTPSVGGFRDDGHGEFLSRETLDGRPILVRFVITREGEDQARFEQAFSADDGKTWETNWIAIDTRSR